MSKKAPIMNNIVDENINTPLQRTVLLSDLKLCLKKIMFVIIDSTKVNITKPNTKKEYSTSNLDAFVPINNNNI